MLQFLNLILYCILFLNLVQTLIEAKFRNIKYQINMQNSGDQFRTKRQNFSNQIRRKNREEIIAKRRNLYNQNQQSQISKSNSNKQTLIIDNRFAQKIKQFQAIEATKQNFPSYVLALNDNDILKKHYGIIGMRKFLTISNSLTSHIQTVIDNGLVPKFVILAQQMQFPQLQLQAIWCLANIASGNSQQTATVIQKGGIKMFVDLLLCTHPGIVEKSIWTLGNIACDAPIFRDTIVKCGGIVNLVKVAEAAITQLATNPNMTEIIESITWTLSCICRKQPIPNYLNIKLALPVFFYVIRYNLIHDTAIIGNACWAISYFTNKMKQGPTKIDTIQNCIDSGVVPNIVQFLSHTYDVLVVTSLKILGNIACGQPHQIQYILSLGILDKLEDLLGRVKKVYRRQTCWILSNITAGSTNFVQTVLGRKSLVNKLLQRLKEDLPDVRIQICYIFANATEQGDKQKVLAFLLQIGYIKYLTDILQNEYDTNLIYACLQCIETILNFGLQISGDKKTNVFRKHLQNSSTTKKLEQLQHHDEQRIYEEVSRIITYHFDYEGSLDD